ncbi:sigma-70 family RNA polymerase sigma factor [Flavobacteriaceae bacterium 3-367]
MEHTDRSVCNQKVYNQVFDLNSETLRNYLYYQCGDLQQAEDLVQEAFIKLWNNCKKVIFEKARGFLFAVAKNAFYNQVAHKKVVLEYAKSRPQKNLDNETPEYKMEEEEFMSQLQAAVAALPDGQREVFLLNRLDKKTYKEMAEMLGVSQTAIEKRMQKALQKLRKTIKNI